MTGHVTENRPEALLRLVSEDEKFPLKSRWSVNNRPGDMFRLTLLVRALDCGQQDDKRVFEQGNVSGLHPGTAAESGFTGTC